MAIRTIKDVDLTGKTVLIRLDLNVPLSDGKVTDDTRIIAALPSLRYLLDNGSALIVCSHLGRPKAREPEFSLAPVASRLQQHLGLSISMVDKVVGERAYKAAKALHPGDVLLLENTRYEKGETKNDPQIAQGLAKLADAFVNDAFGTAHRAHASNVGVATIMRQTGRPAVAGFLLEKEIEFLDQAVQKPEKPFVAIIGGAKISGKIDVIQNLANRVDKLLLGGGMANTFLAAQGYEMGDSLVESDKVDQAHDLLDEFGDQIVLPVDGVLADSFSDEADSKEANVTDITEGWRMLDIGPSTLNLFEYHLKDARTVVWNGPMGVFEFPRFAAGTLQVARLLGPITRSGGTTIIGGGDSAAAIVQAGLRDQVSHISTGGGASLEMLEGKILPGIAALDTI
ncbi:MAG: phosphoglycerate kinase [Chloroflexota bacterium]